MPVPRYTAPLQFGGEGKDRRLLDAPDVPLHLNSPEYIVSGAEPKLTEGDAHFGEPSLIGNHRDHVPYGVPGRVTTAAAAPTAAARYRRVSLYPRRVGREAVRRLMVVVAVDGNREEVRVRNAGVPTRQASHDGAGVVKPSSDVEGVVVEKKTNVRGLADRLALERIDLREIGHRRRRRPRRLIGHSVDLDARGNPDRTDHWGFGVGEDRPARIGNGAIGLLCSDRREPTAAGFPAGWLRSVRERGVRSVPSQPGHGRQRIVFTPLVPRAVVKPRVIPEMFGDEIRITGTHSYVAVVDHDRPVVCAGFLELGLDIGKTTQDRVLGSHEKVFPVETTSAGDVARPSPDPSRNTSGVLTLGP